MPKHSLLPHLDLPSSDGLGELIGRLTKGPVGRTGHTLSIGTAALAQPSIAVLARPEELQRLLGASIDENRHLTAQVRRLEAELRRSSAQLSRLRGDLRGAVRDARSAHRAGQCRAFNLELGVVHARASSSSPAHLAIVDIDHFKQVNDVHGHDIGDEVLRIVGAVLLAKVRSDSLVARLGGDEFGLLLPGASPHDAVGIAIRLCEFLEFRPPIIRGHRKVSLPITLSIGVAAWHSGEGSARWYARADAALYEAKGRGRNRVAVDRPQQAASRALPAEASEAAWTAATNPG